MFIDWKTQIVKMSILPKQINRFASVSIKISARFLFRYMQDYSKMYRREEELDRIAKTILKKKKVNGKNWSTQFQDLLAILIKMVRLLAEEWAFRSMEQNREL